MIDPEKIWSSSRLPSLPSVVVKLLDISGDPESSIRDYVEIVKSDPAIASRILKSANSAYFGFSSQIASIERAVPLLGSTTVVGLALSFSLSQDAVRPGPLSNCFQEFWERSVIQAATADLLSEREKKRSECDFFLAGLLTDIGILAMLQTIPEDYRPVMEAAKVSQRPLFEVENELLGFNHLQVGRKMLESWNLPQSLLNAIEFHHESLESLRSRSDDPSFAVVKATAVASTVGDFLCTTNDSQSLERLQELTRNFYDFSDGELTEFFEALKPRIESASEILAIDTSAMKDPLELMAEANERLSSLTLENSGKTGRTRGHEPGESDQDASWRDADDSLQSQKQDLRDPVTRLYHQQYLEDSLRKEVVRCCRTADALGLIIARVDRFSDILNQHGLAYAESVLHRIARLFEEMLREGDVIARFDNESFAVRVHHPTEKTVQRLSERLRARIELEHFENEGVTTPVTLSVGAAFVIPRRTDLDLTEKLFEASQQAVDESSNAGGNQCVLKILTEESCRRLMQLSVSCRFSRWLIDGKHLDAPSVAKAVGDCRTPHKRLGELTLDLGLLNTEQILEICKTQNQTGSRFGEAAIQLGYMNEDVLARLLALQQENPEALAEAIVRLGLLREKTARKLCAKYRKQIEVVFQAARLVRA